MVTRIQWYQWRRHCKNKVPKVPIHKPIRKQCKHGSCDVARLRRFWFGSLQTISSWQSNLELRQLVRQWWSNMFVHPKPPLCHHSSLSTHQFWLCVTASPLVSLITTDSSSLALCDSLPSGTTQHYQLINFGSAWQPPPLAPLIYINSSILAQCDSFLSGTTHHHRLINFGSVWQPPLCHHSSPPTHQFWLCVTQRQIC